MFIFDDPDVSPYGWFFKALVPVSRNGSFLWNILFYALMVSVISYVSMFLLHLESIEWEVEITKYLFLNINHNIPTEN